MHWEYKNKNNNEDVRKILLANRGLTDKASVDKFINPELKEFKDPFLFEEMENIVIKILQRRNDGEPIYIYGDYDVDGITAAVFLVKAFSYIGIKCYPYIPNRMEEGYGLDKKAIDVIKSKNATLVITVDTGINSTEDLKYARQNGLEIIVTDHHKSNKKSEDYITLNPKLSKTYGFEHLSGAGVALKVAQAVYQKLHISEDYLNQFMDIVMIGTVADVVPMIDENRLIIKHGLRVLQNTQVKGLTYLLKYLKMQDKEITTTDVSYYISPLINSLGRIGISKVGAEFFLNDDDFEIYNIIEEMKRANKKRRELENYIFQDACKMIKERKKDGNLSCAFLYSNKWHPGVIGVVASRLCSKFNIPVVLVSVKDGVGKASCRSVEGISVFDLFDKMQGYLMRFGGHDLAAGFIIEEKNLETVRNIFEKNIYVKKDIPQKKLTIDMELSLVNINRKMVDKIRELAPFGIANPHPIFVEKDVNFKYVKKFGINNRHFNGIIEKGGKTYNMVAFELGDKIDEECAPLQTFDIAYYPDKVHYQGEDIIQIKIKDIVVKDEFYDIFIK